jgi:hypothetical protein
MDLADPPPPVPDNSMNSFTNEDNVPQVHETTSYRLGQATSTADILKPLEDRISKLEAVVDKTIRATQEKTEGYPNSRYDLVKYVSKLLKEDAGLITRTTEQICLNQELKLTGMPLKRLMQNLEVFPSLKLESIAYQSRTG